MTETFYLLTIAGGCLAVVMEGSSLAEVERACPGFPPELADEDENMTDENVTTLLDGWFLQPVEDEDYLIARGSDLLDEGVFEVALLTWRAEQLEMNCAAQQDEVAELIESLGAFDPSFPEAETDALLLFQAECAVMKDEAVAVQKLLELRLPGDEGGSDGL